MAQPDVAVLAPATGLADELAFDFHAILADGLAISHLRFADVGFDLELALHAVDQDFQVEFAHAADDGLGGFVIHVYAEGGVFLS